MKKDLWAEGKYVDLWTINHVMSGVVAGSVLFLLDVSLFWSLIISSVVFVLWEVAEFILKWESLTNQFVDLVANFTGYGIFYFLHYHLNMPFDAKTVISIVVIFVALEIWGFSAYKVRKKGQ